MPLHAHSVPKFLHNSSALSDHHRDSSASLVVPTMRPSSLGVLLRFLNLSGSCDSSSSLAQSSLCLPKFGVQMHLLDMQRANLDGQNLCSQIYGRDWILEPPCHSTFKWRGGGGGGSEIRHASLERPGLECPDQRRSSDSGPPLPFCL
jgi:hypothetical protein